MSPVAEYLVSRSRAGTNHQDLIESMRKLTDDQVYGRFFHMYPQKSFCDEQRMEVKIDGQEIGDLVRWLAKWIRKGAIPIATLNLQRTHVRPGQTIPDSWHHQMVFGVGPDQFGLPRVYLTNPLESVDEVSFREQLVSPSELLVRRSDVLQRWKSSGGDDKEVACALSPQNNDLYRLCEQPDERWDHYNVLGQVVNIIREEQFLRRSLQQQSQNGGAGGNLQSQTQLKQHVKIPADYKSGITLFIPESNKTAVEELKNHPELPVIDPQA